MITIRDRSVAKLDLLAAAMAERGVTFARPDRNCIEVDLSDHPDPAGTALRMMEIAASPAFKAKLAGLNEDAGGSAPRTPRP